MTTSTKYPISSTYAMWEVQCVRFAQRALSAKGTVPWPLILYIDRKGPFDMWVQNSYPQLDVGMKLHGSHWTIHSGMRLLHCINMWVKILTTLSAGGTVLWLHIYTLIGLDLIDTWVQNSYPQLDGGHEVKWRSLNCTFRYEAAFALCGQRSSQNKWHIIPCMQTTVMAVWGTKQWFCKKRYILSYCLTLVTDFT